MRPRTEACGEPERPVVEGPGAAAVLPTRQSLCFRLRRCRALRPAAAKGVDVVAENRPRRSAAPDGVLADVPARVGYPQRDAVRQRKPVRPAAGARPRPAGDLAGLRATLAGVHMRTAPQPPFADAARNACPPAFGGQDPDGRRSPHDRRLRGRRPEPPAPGQPARRERSAWEPCLTRACKPGVIESFGSPASRPLGAELLQRSASRARADRVYARA